MVCGPLHSGRVPHPPFIKAFQYFSLFIIPTILVILLLLASEKLWVFFFLASLTKALFFPLTTDFEVEIVLNPGQLRQPSSTAPETEHGLLAMGQRVMVSLRQVRKDNLIRHGCKTHNKPFSTAGK